MPPLPTTAQSLIIQLTNLSDQNKAVLQLIQRLAKLDFTPGVSRFSSDEEGDVRLELSAEIHESLKSIEEELEILRQEVEDCIQGSGTRRRDSTKEGERGRLAVLFARITEDLRSSRSQFRKAQLAAKRNADRAKLKERELLFSNLQSGSSTPSSTHRRKKDNSQLTADEVIANTSSDVTAALRRTHELMQNELSRSRFAQETLEQSSAALADLGEKYTDLNTLLANSKNLVITLLKSQKSDTWYLETAFYILVTTILWLIFRRWLYGPVTWFIWWPLKLVYRITVGLFAATGVLSTAKSSVESPAEPSTSLIIKPSAEGGIPKRGPTQDNQRPYVRVGGGGRGYNYNSDPSPPGSYSYQVGRMAEQKQKDMEEQRGDKEPVKRGDGTVLVDSDKPRNPKKRIWDEEVEGKKREAEREHARQAEQAQQQQESEEKRDEL
ncbi:hypothetical protein CC78DRAFT_535339 [Lojkania enalia]|uniref:Sec20 C-terminal domain-containing protein n=1 Tax=Lojkania enalia TaxID=147567 RepID=A0A9P4N4G1_9PLEO|nr:hypothetical protein CC78DRAFT_535339 [Didymosphaeria enalia]